MDAAFAALNAALAELLALVQGAPAVALAVGLGTHLFFLVLVAVLLARQGRMAKVQRRLLQGADGANLEALLLSHADEMHALRAQVEGARTSGQSAADNLRQCVQRVGVVRYDAYGDVGGRQSFSVALLDGGGNGLVLSGLSSRHDMRVYAKPVTNGDSPLQLTNEERRAISNAAVSGPALIEEGADEAAPAARLAGPAMPLAGAFVGAGRGGANGRRA